MKLGSATLEGLRETGRKSNAAYEISDKYSDDEVQENSYFR